MSILLQHEFQRSEYTCVLGAPLSNALGRLYFDAGTLGRTLGAQIQFCGAAMGHVVLKRIAVQGAGFMTRL